MRYGAALATTTFGDYELIAPLSKGGMAQVYRARHLRTGVVCALKRILPTIAEDPEFVQMFQDEARIAASLEHPHVARLQTFGEVDGVYFIAYELIEGRDLRAVFQRAIERRTPLPLGFLLYVFERIAEGLAYAHARKDDDGTPRAIVHRDVSPQNLLVAFDGDVKLIDFGIAKARGKISRTQSGMIKGKFGYMSPEQVRGDAIDLRTDVFSLGICLWELITLERLFTADDEVKVLEKIKRHDPIPPSTRRADVPPELDRIVLKALAKRQDERYGSARELTRDLNLFVKETGRVDMRASRADVARTMQSLFEDETTNERPPPRPSTKPDPTTKPTGGGRIMDLQETRMSDDNKGSTDLDIFEGLGKKSSARTSAVPPQPPGSSPKVSTKPMEMKRTLMGIPEPAQPPSGGALPSAAPFSSPMPAASPNVHSASTAPPPPPPASGSMRAAAASKPPPPPGRGSLPNVGSTPPPVPGAAVTHRPSQAPPPPSGHAQAAPAAPPTTPAAVDPAPAPVAAKPNGGKLDMDWDDDDEATHVFDKDAKDDSAEAIEADEPTEVGGPETREPEHASMDHILSQPPRASAPPPAPPQAASAPPPPPVQTAPSPQTSTLSGAFASLGQPRESAPPASKVSAPPPPPATMRGPNPSLSTAPLPPPPPPGQTTTAPMHMPAPRPPSAPPPAAHTSAPPPHMPSSMPPPATHTSAPPPSHTSAPPPQMPPVSRAMEATAMVPRPQESRTGLMVAVLLGVMAIVAAAVFLLMPRTGTLAVNVADAKGGAISKLEVTLDDKKVCVDRAPCIENDVPAGVHQVKVVAPGYEQAAARAVTIESGKGASIDFTLTPSKASSGTGIKVSGNQPGVRLSVDGREYGPLPQELRDLKAGDHKITVSGGPRYETVEKTVSVADDEVVDLGNIQLKVLKGKVTVQVPTPGPTVYLVSGKDRKTVPPSFPIAIDFDPSERWQLEAKQNGFDDFVQPISFDDGVAEKTIVVTMSPKGTTPPTTQTLAPTFTTPAAPPVTHATPPATPASPVTAPQPPATPKQPAVATAPQTPAATPKAPAAAGGEAFLNINSLPASMVVLDGKPLGPTPRLKVSVPAGTHTIVFVNSEQSLKKSISVTVAAGETKAAFAKLRTE